MIGTMGSHLSKLVRLAFYLAEIQEYVIDTSTKGLFYDSLRTVVRATGVEGRQAAILLTVKHPDAIRTNDGDTLDVHLEETSTRDRVYRDDLFVTDQLRMPTTFQ